MAGTMNQGYSRNTHSQLIRGESVLSLITREVHNIPGRIGFKLGLTSESPLPFLAEGADVAASFPRATDLLLLASFFAAVLVGGESPLLIPRPPRFMILAGVTGVML